MTRDEMLDKREDVLDEFDDRVDPNHRITTLGEQRWYTAQLMADEIVRLREQLAVSESLREAQVKELSEHVLTLVEALAEDGNALAKAERILAALREPSEKVVEAAWFKTPGNFPVYENHMRAAIRAAVAAAEKEASGA